MMPPDQAMSLTCPGAQFPSTFPKAYPDGMMSDGSLLLIDPEKSALDGVPSDGTWLQNIAWQTASNILGGGDEDSLSPLWKTNGQMAGQSSAKHLIERTTKGGIHGIVSQANPVTASNAWFGFELPTAIKDYLHANLPGREFYVSMTRRLTRAPGTSGGTPPRDVGNLVLMGGTTVTAGFIFRQGWPDEISNIYIQPGTRRISMLPDGSALDALLPSQAAASFNTWRGTKPSVPTYYRLAWGLHGPWSTGYAAALASWVLYRVYIEDLTTSGRTVEEVAALDLAKFTADFGVGGRFADDTFSDPTVVLA
ncbi:hypothetical protein JIN85_16930 [Luteolibacter pohnpeiensis]|uniref:Uncharacterized protein n=1 Tax=Luteolibacter pohnpeiensis TaxID=454153 RepID=A0A934VW00_9BACT|nr:hypothetical protein [Luteolibacter pohnpeiensis]MBK1884107.1 hypothetical protein [Luteolibacter pohnpeiensis]